MACPSAGPQAEILPELMFPKGVKVEEYVWDRKWVSQSRVAIRSEGGCISLCLNVECLSRQAILGEVLGVHQRPAGIRTGARSCQIGLPEQHPF